ncbi:hypothetical protein niasHT_011454 [Heterodera trifolii]|uniref:Uncharacterized protein n=1 Tax=Heterodera trifolii TaxID=157864 RepID=A0ABD2L1D7_9BILA
MPPFGQVSQLVEPMLVNAAQQHYAEPFCADGTHKLQFLNGCVAALGQPLPPLCLNVVSIDHRPAQQTPAGPLAVTNCVLRTGDGHRVEASGWQAHAGVLADLCVGSAYWFTNCVARARYQRLGCWYRIGLGGPNALVGSWGLNAREFRRAGLNPRWWCARRVNQSATDGMGGVSQLVEPMLVNAAQQHYAEPFCADGTHKLQFLNGCVAALGQPLPPLCLNVVSIDHRPAQQTPAGPLAVTNCVLRTGDGHRVEASGWQAHAGVLADLCVGSAYWFTNCVARARYQRLGCWYRIGLGGPNALVGSWGLNAREFRRAGLNPRWWCARRVNQSATDGMGGVVLFCVK